MDAKKRGFNIIAGPGRDLLFDACKYAYDKKANIEVRFTVESNCGMALSDVKISSISHEDGSGESFNLEGFCWIMAGRCSHFKAYYNTKNRTGYIQFD